jgi:hypothetical protein
MPTKKANQSQELVEHVQEFEDVDEEEDAPSAKLLCRVSTKAAKRRPSRSMSAWLAVPQDEDLEDVVAAASAEMHVSLSTRPVLSRRLLRVRTGTPFVMRSAGFCKPETLFKVMALEPTTSCIQ